MGRKCSVQRCPNSTGKPLKTVHKFPVLQAVRKQWINFLKGHLKNVNLENYGVCTFHFRLQDYVLNGTSLRPTAVPELRISNGGYELGRPYLYTILYFTKHAIRLRLSKSILSYFNK